MKTITTILLTAFLLTANAFTFGGTRAFAFLETDSTAVSSSMAGAYSARRATIEGALNNPASLASLSHDLTYTAYFTPALASYFWGAGAAYKIDGLMTVAVAGRGVNYGDDILVEFGTFTANDMSFRAAAAMRLNTFIPVDAILIDVGIAPSYSISMLGTESLSAVSVDVGALITIGRSVLSAGDLSFGVYARNIGGAFSDTITSATTMPIAFIVGAGYAMDVNEIVSIAALVDADIRLDTQVRVNIGAEGTFLNLFSVRAGMSVNTSAQTIDITAGTGFFYDLTESMRINLDYAFKMVGEIGFQHNAQVSFAHSLSDDAAEGEETDTTTKDVVEP